MRRRFDLTDFEWAVIEPLLPNNSRGVSVSGTACSRRFHMDASNYSAPKH